MPDKKKVEFVIQGTEKCPLTVPTGIRIRRVFEKIHELSVGKNELSGVRWASCHYRQSHLEGQEKKTYSFSISQNWNQTFSLCFPRKSIKKLSKAAKLLKKNVFLNKSYKATRCHCVVNELTNINLMLILRLATFWSFFQIAFFLFFFVVVVFVIPKAGLQLKKLITSALFQASTIKQLIQETR